MTVDTSTDEGRRMAAPNAEEVGLWDHVSWAGAVRMYATRNGLDVSDKAVQERIKDVFRKRERAS